MSGLIPWKTLRQDAELHRATIGADWIQCDETFEFPNYSAPVITTNGPLTGMSP